MLGKRLVILATVVAALMSVGLFLALLKVASLHRASSLRILPTDTILQQVQTLSELVTVKYTLQKVVVFEDPKYWAGIIPLGETRLTLLAQGVVKAGVDLSQLKRDDIHVANGSLTLTLPKPVVLESHLEERSTQVLDWHTGLLRTFDKDLEQNARREALLQISRTARQAGIEREAGERARTQLTNLLKLLGFERVEIQFRTGSPKGT